MNKSKLVKYRLRYFFYRKTILYLRRGKVISFPTETFYGIGVDPFNTDSINTLFTLKERDRNKAILLLVENREMVNTLAETIPEIYLPLIDRFWPGPLTLIFKAKEWLNPRITGGTGTIGIRVSSHPVALELCKRWGNAVTATSANIAGRPPAESAGEVDNIFGEKIDFVINGGKTPAGLSSTIIGHEKDKLVLIREGRITFKQLLQAVE